MGRRTVLVALVVSLLLLGSAAPPPAEASSCVCYVCDWISFVGRDCRATYLDEQGQCYCTRYPDIGCTPSGNFCMWIKVT